MDRRGFIVGSLAAITTRLDMEARGTAPDIRPGPPPQDEDFDRMLNAMWDKYRCKPTQVCIAGVWYRCI